MEVPLFGLVQAHRCVLVGTGDYDGRAATATVRLLARLALIIALVESGLGMTGAALGMVGASIAELLACRAFARPPLWGRIAPGVRRLLGEAAPLFAFSIGMRLFERIDLFLVEALGGSPVDAGWYGAALNLAQAPNLFTLAFAPLLLSSLTRLEAAGEIEASRRLGREASAGRRGGPADGGAGRRVGARGGLDGLRYGVRPGGPAALLADLRHDGPDDANHRGRRSDGVGPGEPGGLDLGPDGGGGDGRPPGDGDRRSGRSGLRWSRPR